MTAGFQVIRSKVSIDLSIAGVVQLEAFRVDWWTSQFMPLPGEKPGPTKSSPEIGAGRMDEARGVALPNQSNICAPHDIGLGSL